MRSALVQQHLQVGTKQLHSYPSHGNAVKNTLFGHHSHYSSAITSLRPQTRLKMIPSPLPPSLSGAFLDFLKRAALPQVSAPPPRDVPAYI